MQSAATLPDTEALTVLGFLGEKRSFDWIRLDAALLPEPVPAPTDADLAAEHDAHAADRYTRPETRQITYASVTPEALAAEIEIPEDELRAAYDADDRPPTRPRSAGRSTASASAPPRRPRPPRRGSTPARSTSTRSPPSAASSPRTSTRASSPPTRCRPRRATRSSAPPAPASSARSRRRSARRSTGSTRSWPPSTTPFEEARAELAKDRALEEAQRQIHDDTAHIEDLIAGGATLEEIASETVMELGSVALNAETTGGIADDPAFREAALEAEVGAETDLIELAGGGLATLRVERDRPAGGDPARRDPRPRRRRLDRARGPPRRSSKLAVGYIAELEAGLDFADLAERLGRADPQPPAR